jgi:hypothetical protein
MAGYSKRSLIQKLGIKPDNMLIILNPPENYAQTLGELPENVTVADTLLPGLDFVHFFTTNRAVLEVEFPTLKDAIAQEGMLWISWPKRASGVETDLDGNIIREIGLANGLVDVKVCAVDDVWSGLKFVYRRKDRT